MKRINIVQCRLVKEKPVNLNGSKRRRSNNWYHYSYHYSDGLIKGDEQNGMQNFLGKPNGTH